MPAYASADDLTEYISPDPVPAAVNARLLARAAEAVDRIALGARIQRFGSPLGIGRRRREEEIVRRQADGAVAHLFDGWRNT